MADDWTSAPSHQLHDTRNLHLQLTYRRGLISDKGVIRPVHVCTKSNIPCFDRKETWIHFQAYKEKTISLVLLSVQDEMY